MTPRIAALILPACLLFGPPGLRPGQAAPRPGRAASAVRETTDEDIDLAIAAVKRYLWARQQANGSWTVVHYARRYHLPRGFTTALVTFALLEAGERPENNPRMRKALSALTKIDTKNLRVRSLRALALSRAMGVDKKSPYRAGLVADLKWLMGAKGKFRGAWGETGPEPVGDNACNQYALMALWEAALAGVEVPSQMIRLAEQTWVRRQRKDGGWAFAGLASMKMASTMRMTAAGLASMYVARDMLGKACTPYRHQKVMDRAWAYLDANFQTDFIQNSYTAFCVQRVGMTSGRKFIGGVDWYAIAAAKLAEPKTFGHAYKGYWGPLVRAGYELIVMARGRLPLTFNKLNYGEGTTWDFHPRDVARFTEFMRRQYERPMRWQIVTLTDKVQTLLDAPLMLIAGRKALPLTPPQWALLREYTLRGGTLLFLPAHNSTAFATSAKAALKDLYLPQRKLTGKHYQLQRLPADHPLFRLHQATPTRPLKVPMWGVSDGTRLLAVLCEKDIACAWHRRATATRSQDYLTGAALFLYATGGNKLYSRLRPVFSTTGKAEVRHTLNVAWLKHPGNWCTQPYALDYLSQKLTAENRVALKITRGAAADPAALKGQHLVWMTGSDSFSLGAAELSALRAYLRGGGTLFVNGVGGAKAFNESARKMLDALFEGGSVGRGYLAASSPLLTGKCGDFRGPKLLKLARTNAFRRAAPQPPPVLFGYRRSGRTVAVHVRFGVHDTLDGHTVHAARSYMPPSARNIAANIALHALAQAQKPAGKAK